MAPDERARPWDDSDSDDGLGLIVGSCGVCGCDVFDEEDDGGAYLLCDSCQFYLAVGGA